MNKKEVIAIESFSFSTSKPMIPESLTDALYDFLAQSYHLADKQEFIRLILQPENEGELIVLFGLQGDIAGLTRTIKQRLQIGNRQIMIFTALMYFNPLYTIHPTIAVMGLSQAMKYKLDHPQEESVYIALTNTPASYKLVSKLSDSIYPKPEQLLPIQILSLISTLKHTNGWISTSQHPMVINSPLVPIRGKTPQFYQESEALDEFYLKANPDYMQGNALLTYIPLSLANINYGLKIAQTPSLYQRVNNDNQGLNHFLNYH